MENKIIKKIFFKGLIKDARSDYSYWITRSHEERIAEIELLRKQFYAKPSPRLQRVYRIVKRNQS